MRKIMFSAGEASGDLHGAMLAEAILQAAPETRLIGFGGGKMQAAGVRLWRIWRITASWGYGKW